MVTVWRGYTASGVLLLIGTAFFLASTPTHAMAGAALQQPSAAAMQMQLRGRVLDQASGRPLAGVFVVVTDSAGVRRAGVLSNADGWFSARVSAPGRYTLRLELIGYGTVEVSRVVVAETGAAVDDIRMQQTAITLASIEVEASDAVCRLPREIGAATHQLWEEARKALALAVWGERDAGVAYQVVQYEHTKDLITGELLRGQPHDRRVLSGVGRTPFVSAPAEELATLGYIRRTPDGYTYYGLDAGTLLSPAFSETHCFRLRLGPRSSDLVGLAFEPLPGQTAPDVAGVLWLDRRTMELQHVEYMYTRHLNVGDAPADLFGGRSEFERLPNGAWIVSDWWLRMPQGGVRAATPGVSVLGRIPRLQRLRASGLTIREEGGAVRYLAVGAAPAGDSAGASIAGIVYDSTRMRPLRGATVFLEGTTTSVRADGIGRFRFTDLAPGEYRAGFFHPYTDSLKLSLAPIAVQAGGAGGSDIVLAVSLASACAITTVLPGDALPQDATVGMVGFVLDRRGVPAPGTTITATWGGQVASVLTDDDGRYVLCNVPANGSIQINSGRTRITMLTAPSSGVMRQNLVLR